METFYLLQKYLRENTSYTDVTKIFNESPRVLTVGVCQLGVQSM